MRVLHVNVLSLPPSTSRTPRVRAHSSSYTWRYNFRLCIHRRIRKKLRGHHNIQNTSTRHRDILLAVFFCFFFNHHFYFPAQLVGGFTLNDLLDKPWSQVSSNLPPGTCLQFLSRIGFSIATARRFSSNVAISRSRAFR